MRRFIFALVIIILFSNAATAATVKGFWMSSPVGGTTQCEIIRYEANLGVEWPDDLKIINQEISMAALHGRFANLTQLEDIINVFLKNEHIGDGFKIVDVERIDLLNP